MEQIEQPVFVQALPATPKKEKESHRGKTSAAPGSPQAPSSSSRFTRSKVAPDWTTYESLVLVSEIAAMDEDWLKALSSYQKWKMISDNCVALDVIRTSNQCKRRWDSLYAGYRKIRDWESRHGEGSYWSLSCEKKKQLGLPTMFDQEVYSSMDAVIKPQEDRGAPAEAPDLDSENLIDADASEDTFVASDVEMLDDNDAQGIKKNVEDESLDGEKAIVMSSKLQEHTQQVHAVLRGELEDDLGFDPAQVDLTNPSDLEIEFTRCQADQLIKALKGLVGPLDQFAELIRAGNCGGI
ncbi:hypothetical protein Cni_G03696 [Canna indica]|uniref:Myb-like domain-containing protein n=1 Tax=Canna indica TaxID=4628 RepID=A0AAQ3JUD5_9LILI|nr:hypothetical protein Cni_G03696 [Canna indica]